MTTSRGGQGWEWDKTFTGDDPLPEPPTRGASPPPAAGPTPDFPSSAGAFAAGLCFGPLGLIYAAALSPQVPEARRKDYLASAWWGVVVQVAIVVVTVLVDL